MTKKIKEIMKQKNMSQTDLANKMGVSRQYICTLLKTDRNFRISTVIAIANALDVKVNLLIY